ncbi:MAG: hypothetical protein ACI308_00135, partial [Muribaculaceae bacterium]
METDNAGGVANEQCVWRGWCFWRMFSGVLRYAPTLFGVLIRLYLKMWWAYRIRPPYASLLYNVLSVVEQFFVAAVVVEQVESLFHHRV